MLLTNLNDTADAPFYWQAASLLTGILLDIWCLLSNFNFKTDAFS